MIPLEYFDAPIRWFLANAVAPIDTLVLVGHSRGSEAALLLGAHRDDVAAVIATMPNSVAFQGSVRVEAPGSGWSLGGEPIPYVSCPADYDVPVDRHDRRLYEVSMQQTAMVDRASIPVE